MIQLRFCSSFAFISRYSCLSRIGSGKPTGGVYLPSTIQQQQQQQQRWSRWTSIVRSSGNVTETTISSKEYDDDDTKRKIPKNFVPVPFQYHEELTLRVSSLTNLGLGICRTPPSNWVIMVPNVIPGELVKLRIYRNYKTYSDADLIEILEPSPHRIAEPKCSLSSICGGCQYQHMTIDHQRYWKRMHVRDAFDKIGGWSDDEKEGPCVLPTIGTDELFHYRSKITPHYEAPRNRDSIEAIGFKRKQTRHIVDVPYCAIATHEINARYTELREELQTMTRNKTLRRPKKGATLLLRHTKDDGVVIDPNRYVSTEVFGLTFRFLAGNFFQNNPYVLPIMVQHVIDAATTKAHPEDGGEMTHLIDCYCGSGLFCLTAASAFRQCVGIEVNVKAVEEATFNARRNQIRNCAFVSASAEAIFEGGTTGDDVVSVCDFPRRSTVVVIDPPRKGCSVEFLMQLREYGPQRVVYMSCDPATQARDAKILVEDGVYDVTSIQPFDLFPQTRHIENLVVFERVG